MDYSSLGPSVLGILQARILEWVAISFSYVKNVCVCVCVYMYTHTFRSLLTTRSLYELDFFLLRCT